VHTSLLAGNEVGKIKEEPALPRALARL